MFKLCLVLTSCLVIGLCKPPTIEYADKNNTSVLSLLFFCKSESKYISRDEVCDGIAHCEDSSDEDPEMCKKLKTEKLARLSGKSHSSYTEFYCNNGIKRINLSQVCNKIEDCADKSDEDRELCETWFCSPDAPFKCGITPLCLSNAFVCDGNDDCGDGYDEDPLLLCNDNYNMTQFINGRNPFIDMAKIRPANGVRPPHPSPYPFTCADGTDGLALEYVCDGNPDCLDKSDEKPETCKTWKCAPEISFKCESYGLCIPKRLLCDLKEDCPDGSDENNILCGLPEEALKRPEEDTFEEISEEKYVPLNNNLIY